MTNSYSQIKMIKAVIFDLDDTIIDTEKHIIAGLDYVLTKHKSFFPNKTKKELIKANQKVFTELLSKKNITLSQIGKLAWINMFKLFNLEPTPYKVSKLYQTLQSYVLNHISIEPGFLKLIRWLRLKEIKIAILSDGLFEERINKLKQIGLLRKIDLLVSTDLVGKEKPNKKPFLYTLDLLKMKVTDVLYIGDSLSRDITGALNYGITPILYKRTSTKKHITHLNQKVQCINNHEDLIKIILRS